MNNNLEYDVLWESLKRLLRTCYEDTEPDKMVDEKKMYVDLLEALDLMEHEMIEIKEEQENE